MVISLPHGEEWLPCEVKLIRAVERIGANRQRGRAGPGRLPHALLTMILACENHISIGGERHTLGPGDALLIPPRAEFHAVFGTAKPLHVINISFRAQVAVGPPLEELLPPLLRAQQDTSGLRRAMEACVHAASSGFSTGAEIELAAVLLEMARLRLRQSAAAYPRVVRCALEHIRAHSGQPLRREEIAAVCCVHPNHLSHLMRRHTGLTLTAHMQRARIAQAKMLMDETTLNLSQIAQHLKMDLPAFSKLFKQVTGVPPRDYARSTRLGEHSAENLQSDKQS